MLASSANVPILPNAKAQFLAVQNIPSSLFPPVCKTSQQNCLSFWQLGSISFLRKQTGHLSSMPVLSSQPATAVSYQDAEVQVSISAEDVACSAENTTVLTVL